MATSGAPAPPRFNRSSPRKKQQLRSRRLGADFAAGEAEAARASARSPLPASRAVSAQSPIWRALPREFFEVDALDLAPRLLGKLLRRDEVVLRITKVEAYRPNDSACHGCFGITARTVPVDWKLFSSVEVNKLRNQSYLQYQERSGLSTDWSHHPLYTPGGLEVLDGPEPESILVGPRVGIEYALPEHVAAPWRFTVAGIPWISAPKNTLRPR